MHPEEFLRIGPGPPFFQIKEAAERERGGEGRGAPQEPSAMSVFTSVFGVSSFARQCSNINYVRWVQFMPSHWPSISASNSKNTIELIPQPHTRMQSFGYFVFAYFFYLKVCVHLIETREAARPRLNENPVSALATDHYPRGDD